MQRSRTQRFFAYIVAIVLFAYVFYIGTALLCYDPLVFVMKKTDSEWAAVQKDCQQLADAVPGLLKTASTDANFDKTVITQLTTARDAFKQTNILELQLQSPANPKIFNACQKTQDDLIRALLHFQSAAAGNAALQSNDTLKKLPSELEQIQNARKAFNEKAAIYNAKARSFPDMVISNAFGFFQKPYFTTNGK